MINKRPLSSNSQNLMILNNNNELLTIRKINSKDEILLAHSNNEYHFPGGHVEDSEELLDALKREIKEETGVTLNIENINSFAKKTGYYKDWPEKGKNRKIQIYYFLINKDIVPNLKNVNYTESEKQGHFIIKNIKLNELKRYWSRNVRTT